MSSWLEIARKAKDIPDPVVPPPRVVPHTKSNNTNNTTTNTTTNASTNTYNNRNNNRGRGDSNRSGRGGGRGRGVNTNNKNNNHNTNSNNNRSRGGNIKHLIYGDSFVRLFGLISSPLLRVKAFKGATARGLSKPVNDNKKLIKNELSRFSNVTDVVFGFGNVDVHLSYYYKKYTIPYLQKLQENEKNNSNNNDNNDNDNDNDKKESLFTSDVTGKTSMFNIDEVAHDYVTTICSFKELQPNANFTVVGCYPSSLDDDDVPMSLMLYGAIPEELKSNISLDDTLLLRRQNRVIEFNEKLQFYCEQYSINYIDLYNEQIDVNTNKLQDIFRDVADMNIHVIWETTLGLWLEKQQFQWLKQLASSDLEQKLKKSLLEYLETKSSWTKREHPVQKEG